MTLTANSLLNTRDDMYSIKCKITQFRDGIKNSLSDITSDVPIQFSTKKNPVFLTFV